MNTTAPTDRHDVRIEIDRVNKVFGAFEALRPVSVDISPVSRVVSPVPPGLVSKSVSRYALWPADFWILVHAYPRNHAGQLILSPVQVGPTGSGSGYEGRRFYRPPRLKSVVDV